MLSNNRLTRLIKTVMQLGFTKSAFFALYQFAKRSGFYRLYKSHPPDTPSDFQLPDWTDAFFPSKAELSALLKDEEIEGIYQKAEFILSGKELAFGYQPHNIEFANASSNRHWSTISDDYKNGADIKIKWEAARFSWVFPLLQAFILSDDEKYFHSFKAYFQSFSENNPLNKGLHWTSGQEIGIRLMALICAFIVFSDCKSWDSEFERELLDSIWLHAHRIPPTLIYARAQNNNHLLSEALALFYAGAFFSKTPWGIKTQKQGWNLFNQTLQKQLQPNGTYVQQSMNYHRLMLTEAIWFHKLASLLSTPLPFESTHKLTAATQWLGQFVQPDTGKVPNLGHNDGSLIFPLSVATYADYRPILNACQICFSPSKSLIRSDYASWLKLSPASTTPSNQPPNFKALPILRAENMEVYLRAEKFNDRPAHADQNHTDIWFAGENIALDAGTYRYTDLPPWNNGLAHTLNHNTLTINDSDQMTWAGRFRWLDWSTGYYLTQKTDALQIAAQHDGYAKFGVLHRREIQLNGNKQCLVTDTLLPIKQNPKIQSCRLHWLLPDGDWKIRNNHFELTSGNIYIKLILSTHSAADPQMLDFSVIRAGQYLHGSSKQAFPTLGWVSPSYNIKQPALSVLASMPTPTIPMQINSQWIVQKVR